MCELFELEFKGFEIKLKMFEFEKFESMPVRIRIITTIQRRYIKFKVASKRPYQALVAIRSSTKKYFVAAWYTDIAKELHTH